MVKSESWLEERIRLWRSSVSDLPLVWLFAFAAAGVYAEEVARVPSWVWLVPFLILVAWMFLARGYTSQWRWLSIWLATSSLFAMFHAEHLRELEKDRSFSMASDEWSPIVMEGIVDSVPRWRPDLMQYEMRSVEPIAEPKWQTIFDLRLESVRDRSEWKKGVGRVTLTLEGNRRDLLPGDRVQVFGKWQRFPPPTNPGQFDIAAHYRKKGQFVRVRTESVDQAQRIGTANAWRLDRWMARILVRGDDAIHRYVGLGQSKLASALVLGQRDQVEWEMQESLLATGTMHMLAISGLHVEMVAISLVTICLLFHMPRKGMLVLTAIVVVGYGILCGGQPPVLRAVILVVAVCVARWTGRTTQSMNLLALAGLILLSMRTSNLFDIGTQLSFLAVAMLSLLSMHYEISDRDRDPVLQLEYEASSWWVRQRMELTRLSWEMLRTSGWVWLVTSPLVLSTFHVISPIAIVLNLLLWIPLFIGLMSGLLLVVFGTWFPPAGYLFGGLCGLCLAVSQWIIEWGEQIPGGHWWLPAPSIGWTILFYCFLLAFWAVVGFARSRRWVAAIALVGWCSIGLLPSLVGPQGKFPLWRAQATDALKLTFVDVGHGSSVIIQTPSGATWLYDSGRLGDGDRSFQNTAAVLWHEGLARVDGVFLSHADSDHYNAIEGLSKRFYLSHLATTNQVVTHSSPALREMLKGLEKQRVELEIWADQGRQDFGSVCMTANHPPPQGVTGSDNANSLCLLIEFAGKRIFLTGDLEQPGTRYLTENHPPTDVDILMAPHHGSVTQDPQPLLDWCQPEIVVISGGPRAIGRKVLAAYASPQRSLSVTHRDGAIRVELYPDGKIRTLHWSPRGWISTSKPTE